MDDVDKGLECLDCDDYVAEATNMKTLSLQINEARKEKKSMRIGDHSAFVVHQMETPYYEQSTIKKRRVKKKGLLNNLKGKEAA